MDLKTLSNSKLLQQKMEVFAPIMAFILFSMKKDVPTELDQETKDLVCMVGLAFMAGYGEGLKDSKDHFMPKGGDKI